MTNQEFVDEVMRAAGIKFGIATANQRKVFVTRSFATYGLPSIIAVEFEGSPAKFQVVCFSESIYDPIYVEGKLIRSPGKLEKIRQAVESFTVDK